MNTHFFHRCHNATYCTTRLTIYYLARYLYTPAAAREQVDAEEQSRARAFL